MATVAANHTDGSVSTKPLYQRASFVADDGDDHDYIFDVRALPAALLNVDNPADTVVDVTVYGAQTADSDVGDGDVRQVGSFQVPAAGGRQKRFDVRYPYLIIRFTYGSTPGDTETLTGYLNAATGAGSGFEEGEAVSINAVTLDDDPTSSDGSAVDILGAEWITVQLDLAQSETPTANLIVRTEFRTGTGATWREDSSNQFAGGKEFAPAQIGASTLSRTYTFEKPANAREMRVTIESTGTEAGKTYTVTATVSWRGAH